MKQAVMVSSLLGLGMMSGCANPPHSQSRVSHKQAQSAHTLDQDATLELEYLLYLPRYYYTTTKDWPLLVFLHGMGERGSDLNEVKKQGPPKLIEEGRQFKFIVVSPQCTATSHWTDETAELLALIETIVERYRVDERRIYVTGLSMGGSGTWAIAEAFPGRFAAIAPICGDGDPVLAARLMDLPVWAFHGGNDPVVPWEKSQEMVDAVNQAGGDAKLTIYPGTGHDSWSQTYEDKHLYKWFLSHSR